MASTYLTRTIGSGSNGTTFTISFWLKISSTSANHTIVGLSSDSNSTKYVEVALKSNHKLDIQFRNGTSGNNGTYLRRRTNRLFRDNNSWYHIVVRVDSTQNSASDRFRLYVNGVQETSIDVDSTPDMPQNYVTDLNNNGSIFRIGRGAGNSSYYLDGSLSHFHFADGQSLAPTVFGETDSTTGEWKIIASPTFTVGTEGFTILKDGNTITDQSSNSNNFTLGGGTLTKTEDCPSNVFATLNPLVNNYGEMMALTQGNLTCESTTSSPAWKTAVSTLGMTSGKYYWEVKFVNVHNAYNTGVMGSNILSANAQNPMNQTGWTGFYNYDGGEIRKDGNLTTNDYGTYSTNDIMGVACDMDNYTISFYKNGVAHVSNASLSTTGRDVVFPASCHYQTNGGAQASYNFGNGYFGTTAVATNSGNGYAGAEGSSIFNYQPPTGYSALSTKGLNE